MNDSQNYKTSNDYKHLTELLKSGKIVICFVTYNWNHNPEKPMMTTDVCSARYDMFNDNPEHEYTGYKIGCRGTMFITTYNYDKKYNEGMTLDEIFCEYCKRYELTYIEPTQD